MASQTERMLETQLYYILDENKTIIPATFREWAKFNEESPLRWVKQEDISLYHISTVFLGIDHGFPPFPGHEHELSPVLFETMVFEEESQKAIYQKRYSRWDEAEKGHEKAVKWVKNGCKE